ncbi:MAG: DeoR/GlpR family DNA-binding transcription regulator [Chloroflexi bacterium]|nr:DeoR/GlpR family DNA-binding transcription regulator [Chloroflexota bacterium]
MTIAARRQLLLNLLREEPGANINQLARRLQVSPGTIRGDLNALQAAGEIARVRGGGVPRREPGFTSADFAARLPLHAQEKAWIARYAASLVENGDSLILDASTTAFALVPHLLEHSHLTIITNGIETALALARNPTHTVLLTGGALRTGSGSVGGALAGRLLADLHAKTAFVSCSGFSASAGLTEQALHEIDLKKCMIQAADQVVALIDSSKFGKVDLTPFASLEQITHLVTDQAVNPEHLRILEQRCASLTLCSPSGAVRHVPCAD